MNPQPPVTNMRIGALLAAATRPREQIFRPRPPLAGSAPAPRARLDASGESSPLGAFLRFLLLGMKPPHFDEGINGWFVDQMVKNGFYRYDPTNYHGPLHFYILFLSPDALRPQHLGASAAGRARQHRFVYADVEIRAVRRPNVSRLAALAMAISPGFVFYGRYSIHEVWLLLFSMLFILGLLGLWQLGTRNYLWCVGIGIGRDDPDEGDLHHPHRLRADRGGCAVDFAQNHADAGCEARARSSGTTSISRS